jgi:oxygen-independent coproporphyrinogen III oxidase
VTQILTRLPRPRDVTNEFGIYVHVPFCSHRCWYCDFNAYAGLDHFADAYMHALVRDVELGLSAPEDADLGERPVVTSVFIGGGTPTLVSASSIARVVAAIRSSWTVASDAEITIECNPESLDADKLDTYLEAGINRVSIGVQSLDPVLLERLGRTHTADRAVEMLRLAQDRGFANVSADLIFGIPGEDEDAWRASLEGVLATGVPHVSAYALIYEEGTPLDEWRKLGKVVPVPDDDVADRWEAADAMLSSAGLERYEISNWSRPGHGSRHNSMYWACGEYLGVGAGAHSHLATGGGARRSWTVKGPERYVRAVTDGGRPVLGSEVIDERTRGAETMILGLRTTAGVRFEDFEGLVGRPIRDVYGEELARGVQRGLLEDTTDRVRLVNPLMGNAAGVLFA